MTAGELLIKLGFEVDTLKLNEFIKDIGDLNMRAVIAATGFGVMIEGLKNIMKASDDVAASLNRLTGITGVNQGAFQQWENIAQQFNVAAGATAQTISTIQKNIELAKIGQGNLVQMASVFGPRGVKFQGRENDPQGVLHDILKSMEGLDAPSRRLLLNAAGIDEQMSLLVGHEDEVLKQTKNQLQDWQRLQENITTIKKLTADWQVFITSIGALLATIFDPVLEALNTIEDYIIKITQNTPEWLKKVLILGGAAAVGARIGGPVGAGVATAVFGGSMLFDLLKPKDQTNNNTTNGGDLNQTNTYNIQGNDPNAITQRIQELHQQQQRDAQYQSPLTSY